MDKPNYQLQTLGRALDLLIWLEHQSTPRTLTEIAEGLGFTPPMAFRILNTLRQKGFVVQIEGGKRYAVPPERDRLASLRNGLRLLQTLVTGSEPTSPEVTKDTGSDPSERERILQLMSSFQIIGQTAQGEWELLLPLTRARTQANSFDLHGRLRPIMESLHSETGETVGLFVTRGLSQIVIDMIAATHPLRYVLEIGSVQPLHRGAAGKAALAWMSQDDIQAFFESAEFADDDLDRDMIIEDLRSIRQRGYSVSSGERVPGAAATGIAIFDNLGEMQGVLNLTAPIARAPEAILHEWGERLIAKLQAAGITHLPPDHPR
ncbi:MAG: IclR family transcriptional regulator [Pararhodobacter sp.]|nr:IclR family transcriptional regulator [Pararhodobacter sp.]